MQSFGERLLSFGTHEEVMIFRKYVFDNEWEEAIDHAPPGIFEPRSWAYWNLKMGRYPTL